MDQNLEDKIPDNEEDETKRTGVFDGSYESLDPLNKDIESACLSVLRRKKSLRKKKNIFAELNSEIYPMSKKHFKNFSTDFNEQSNEQEPIISPFHFEKKKNSTNPSFQNKNVNLWSTFLIFSNNIYVWNWHMKFQLK